MRSDEVLEWANRHPLSHPMEIPQEVLDRLEAASITPEDDEAAAEVLVEWAECYAAAASKVADVDFDVLLPVVRAIGRTLHIESLRRRGVVEVEWYGPDPWAPDAVTTVPRH